jgi:hypothetical protein
LSAYILFIAPVCMLLICMQAMLTSRTSCSNSSSSHGGAAPAGSYGGSDSSSSGDNNKQLQEVVFLCRAKADQQRYQCGDFCKHHSPQQMQLRVTQFAGAVGGSMNPYAADAQPHTAAAAAAVGNGTPVSMMAAAAQEGAGVIDQAQRGSTAATLHAGRGAGDIKAHQQQQQRQQSAGSATAVEQLQVSFAMLPCEAVRLHHHACGAVSSRVWGSFGPTDWFQ